MALGTIFLEVGDWATAAACRDWYVAHLGCSVDHEEEGHSVWLDAGNGLTLGFHEGDVNQSPSTVNFSFDVADCDAEAARLQAAGVALVAEPWDAPWGARVATMVDPAGHGVWVSGPLKS
jgi:predicted enzyme related to lactoylglutathione lyase